MAKINSIVWGIATILLTACGLYYTFKLKFPQFKFKSMFKSLAKDNNDKNAISPFETLTLAMAARIGVGSLSGIALGIYKGGVGVIFWIWLSALITIPNTLVESALAVKYRERDGKYYKGGPAYYIKKGLGYKKMAVMYAIVISLCYLGGFLAIQANTISKAFNTYTNTPVLITGIVVAIISFLIIYKGLKSITSFVSKLVPIMGIGYLIICLIVIFKNISMLPNAFISIFKAAFNVKALGYGIISSIIIGVQRGIFSSESGIGTGACASGTSDTDSPIKQGMLQMIGVYFTTFIVCTSTALIILVSNVNLNDFSNVNGIEIVQSALVNELGPKGNIMLLLAIVTFAFSTVVSGYYYGESNIKYLFKNMDDKKLLILKVAVALIILYGAIARPSSLWDLVDIGVGILAILNIIAIFLLRKDVEEEYNYYERTKINR